MKKTTKALLLTACALVLVIGSVFGTLAYLTSQDSVTNTFTVGNVIITLDEKDVDNSTAGENDRDKANSYKLLPGHQYEKDPIVHVDPTSENCYLFVKVVNEIAAIEDETTVANQMKAKGWIAVAGVENTFVYVGTAEGTSAPLAVSANSDITVFESFKIKGSVTNEQLAAYAGETIVVTAYAVQTDGFENEAAVNIWNTAFGAQQ